MSEPAKGILVSHRFPAEAEATLLEQARQAGLAVRFVRVPEDPEARVAEADLQSLRAAFYSSDLMLKYGRSFFSAVRKAPNLDWVQICVAGVDHPAFVDLLKRGKCVTNASGTTAVPIAQTAITGLMMLLRGFPHWLSAQRRREWDQLPRHNMPRDIGGQWVCVLGMGNIGTEIARLAQAFGMKVAGIRRSPRRPEDPVDAMHPPAELAAVLPRCQALVVACPLTDETRGLVNAAMLAALPRGAQVVNIARGEVINEAALIQALRTGHVAGAYLDVFEREPLPPESPLWDMPNVIASPHNSFASSGNEARLLALFLDNAACWLHGRPMRNVAAL